MGRTEDLANKELELQIENKDKKEDSQRQMAWAAITALIFYGAFTLIAACFSLPIKENLIISLGTIWIPATAAIVMTFFGAEAYAKKR